MLDLLKAIKKIMTSVCKHFHSQGHNVLEDVSRYYVH